LKTLPKLHLTYVEFYITNFCNFNCIGCNRFNNYVFTGQQLWKDYSAIYQQWSQRLDIDKFTILGGEPMTNPDYVDWLVNISQLWPNARGSFLTNGHYLKADNRELYQAIKRTNGLVTLDIGLHNLDRRDAILSVVKDWLEGDVTVNCHPENIRQLHNFDQNWVESYLAIRDSSWPDCPTSDDWLSLPEHVRDECKTVHKFSPELLAESRLGYCLTDSNGVTVIIQNENYFHQGALKPKANSFELYNSDPIKSHAVCHSKTCHHFDKGLLYKCGLSSLFKEFDQQFYLDLTPSDRDLMQNYQPASADGNSEDLLKFINNLNQPIPQCKFCPEYYDIKEITAEHGKKVKFQRKKNVQNHI
jgi:hypothetical protein